MGQAARAGPVKAEAQGKARSPEPLREPMAPEAAERAAQAGKAPAAGSGDPLPPPDRRRAETSLGVPLSTIRVHRGRQAERSAARIGARGYGVGANVMLGAGAGPETLGHELVHYAQRMRHGLAASARPVDGPNSPAEAEARRLGSQVFAGRPLPVRTPADAHVHRDGPKSGGSPGGLVIVPVGGGGALGAYPGLKAALDPADWNALSAGARRRSQTVAAGGVAPPAEDEAVATEVKVPLKKLFRPPTEANAAATGQDYVKDLYTMGVSQAGTGAMGMRLQREILGRWLETESGILAEEVTIGLVDPGAKGKGAGAFLTFTLRDVPIPTTDGTLMAGAVDGALNAGFPGIVSNVQTELSGLEMAINAGGKAKATLEGARTFAAKADSEFVVAVADEADKALRARIDELGKITDQPFAGFVAAVLADAKSYVDGPFAERRKSHTEWRAKNPREKGSYEQGMDRSQQASQTAKKLREEGGILNWYGAAMWDQSATANAQGATTQDMVTLRAGSQKQELGGAYDKGLISFSQYEEAADAATTRGNIALGVTAVIAVATLGLGLYLAPATLGGQVLFGVTTGFVAGVAPMLASNIYTEFNDLSDPDMQKWFKGGSFSTGDILLGGAIGAGIGAALPVAGRLMGALGRTASPAAIIAGELPLPEGVIARSTAKGVVELSIPAENVTIRVSKEGWQMIGPSGNNPKAVLGSGAWAEGGGPMIPGEPIDILHPNYPSRVMMGDRGWGVMSPRSASPLQFGMWDELALPPGGAGGFEPGFGGGGPMVVADDAGGRLVISSSGSGPAPTPGFGKPQLFLPPGPRPFGLLPAPWPEIVQTGPLAPPNWAPTDQWGSFIQQRGPSLLPPAGEGGIWQKSNGIWLPTYYSQAPARQAALTTYGQADPNFLFDVPGQGRTGIVQPNQLLYGGARRYPMLTPDMDLAGAGYRGARSHIVPHAETKAAGPGQILSTADPNNYLAHPRRYNEWLRRTIEGRLNREGNAYVAFNQIGTTPTLTTGGYVIPEAEYFVQYGLNGQPVRAWRFPFDNLNAYDSLAGNINDVLASFEVPPSQVPKAKIGK